MAQKVLVQLVDDLDGTSSDDVTTVRFGLDGVSYEIDLNAANAERLRKVYADYVEAGRRTGGRLKAGSRPGGKAARSGEAGQIREWALENGFELSGRGRIPSHVVEAYKEAQQPSRVKAVPATKNTTKRRAAKKA
jgi:nucleoid-associated protein Lsr2